ncbi:LysR family transcriptional regulator [Rodentibacter myodis]|uniref:Transcriptional regulator n=1 Tax=Rodentibacter myodis TaxID=1907939 RepID=A0A1V3JI42_9PAST|nr:LysR family transcriptional regulator [Rodentibacter myodis]OOF56345.1 transcriptional regulator [Rodentibacter myodis]
MSLNYIDLNLLKTLNALLLERNVSRAAERLNLTQPAVSAMLGRLRHLFNDPLFIRTSHGMLPTDRALALAEPIAQILQQIEIAVQPVNTNPAALEMTFRIAATENGMQTLAVPFAFKIAQLAPKVKIALLPIQGIDVEEKLANGECDLAIAADFSFSEQLYHQALLDERYICAVRRDHPVLQQEWNLDRFCELDFVLVSYQGGQFEGATDEALEKLGRKRKVMFSISHFSLLPDFLNHTDLAAVAPYHYLAQQKDLVLLEPPLEIQGYRKVMAWHARSHHNPIQKWFRQVMKAVAEEVVVKCI